MKTIFLEKAVAMIPNGASLMIGGFMAVGTPERVMDEIVHSGQARSDRDCKRHGEPGKGIGKLVGAELLRKLIASHIGLNPETQQQMNAGELQVELIPQGTLVERIRCGGYGLGGVLDSNGCRHHGGREKAKDRSQRQALSSGNRAARRFRPRPCFCSRLPGQSGLRAHGPELQPCHGHGGGHRHAT